MEDQQLSQAIIAYLGKGRSSFPRTDEEAVLALESETESSALLEKVLAAVAEMMSIEIDWSTHTLPEGGDEAARVMAKRHPELTEEALVALRWMFTYNWR